MKTVTNLNEAITKIRKTLISQSELPEERVLSSLSLEGTELDKLLEEQIYNSIEQNNPTLLFELVDKPSVSNVSMEEGDIYTGEYITCKSQNLYCNNDIICGDFVIDRSIISYKMFNLRLILYGQYSSEIAIKLSTRLRSQYIRSDLYNSGIYIEDVSEPTIINEFKNDTMWLRNDINISLGLKFLVPLISSSIEYKNINNIYVIKEENIDE